MKSNQWASPAEIVRLKCARKSRNTGLLRVLTAAEPLLPRRARAIPIFIGLAALVGASLADAAHLLSSSEVSNERAGVDGPSVPSLPPNATVSFAPSSIDVGEISVMTIALSNPNPADFIVGMYLTDHYPAGLINKPNGAVMSDTCGFIEDVANANTTYLSNGSLQAGASCAIAIQVVGAAPAVADNHTGIIGSSNAPDGADASAILTVGVAPPTVQKSFDPAVFSVGGTSRMTIKLTNPNATDAIIGARFTDNYPSPLMIANADVGAIVSNTCDGTLDAPAAGTKVALTGGMVPANDSCSVVINVVGTSPGSTTNHTGSVDSDNAISGADAVALAIINNVPLLNAPVVTETFTPANVDPGGNSQMKIRFTNPNAGPIFAAQLDDIYPIGMINANSIQDPVLSDTCGFNHDVPRGSGWAKLSGGTIPANQTCDIVINVVADVMTSTTLTNTTGPVAGSNVHTSAGASAVLTVDSNIPSVTCVLPDELDIVGDMIDIDLSTLFAPPPGKSLIFGVTNPAPGLTLVGSLLSGTLSTAGTVTTTFEATATPGGLTASEDVQFDVLPLDELVFRDGFGDLAVPCQ